ncbi:MAG: hypothetical protein IJ737_01050 [Ruminococcus sp.]|nr:hypothetical protein [Ruminococcus sp.]
MTYGKYDYSVDSYTNELENNRNASSIFFACGVPPLIVFFPELWRLHSAGHNFLMFLLGLVIYAAGIVPFMRFVEKPIRKKVYGPVRQDFRLYSIILLMDIAAGAILFIRYRFGIFAP